MINVVNFDTALEDFGVSVTLGAATFNAIFDDEFTDPLGISASAPVLLGYATDLASAAPGDAITVDGDAYTVTSVEPDGTGMVRLRLREAA